MLLGAVGQLLSLFVEEERSVRITLAGGDPETTMGQAPVNFRVVVDKETHEPLPGSTWAEAKSAAEKGLRIESVERIASAAKNVHKKQLRRMAAEQEFSALGDKLDEDDAVGEEECTAAWVLRVQMWLDARHVRRMRRLEAFIWKVTDQLHTVLPSPVTLALGGIAHATKQAREASEARPQLAIFGSIAILGSLLGLVSAVAAIIRLGKDDPAPTVTTTESLVIVLVLVAALSTPSPSGSRS